jgi:pyruvate,water dikinase
MREGSLLMSDVTGGTDGFAELRRWHFLTFDRFCDPSVPKLHNLFRVQEAGLRIPPTGWALAADLNADWPIPIPDDCSMLAGFSMPLIIRSGSPSEDTNTTSNAGQFKSLVVREPAAFPGALADVIAALPYHGGTYQGIVFIQPLIDAEVAGISFFDGFYFEETSAAGGNQSLTSGQERGDVRRGHLERGDSHSEWLRSVYDVFRFPVDIEWAIPRTGRGPGQSEALRMRPGTRAVLQVRPALFPIRRNETLSLANHKEILGDLPSRWMVGSVEAAAGCVMSYFAAIDPAIAAWKEPYAIALAERAWLNLSAFYRLMDHLGLPRGLVPEGIGGLTHGSALDKHFVAKRFIRSLPRLLKLQWKNIRRIQRVREHLQGFDQRLDASESLPDLWKATVDILAESIQTMMALGGIIAGLNRVRRALGIRRGARIITHEMMDEYARLAALPDEQSRVIQLETWLQHYGHRGPLESDPSQPRFIELREALEADLKRRRSPAQASMTLRHSRFISALVRPFFLADEWRERFKHDVMRRWQLLRTKILLQAGMAVTAGWLDSPADVFLLAGDDLGADPSTWRSKVADRRARIAAAQALRLPVTASRDTIEAIVRSAAASVGTESGPANLPAQVFSGFGLGHRAVTGVAVRAAELTSLFARSDLPEQPILVTPTLDPAWAVVFPRFAAIVVELGGELSHASILLREMGQTAVVNARGAYQNIADGASLQVDPTRGEVRVR